MKKNFAFLLLTSCLLLVTAQSFAQAKNNKPLAKYQTIIVEKATIEQSPSTRDFPGGHDAVMQKSIVANLQEKKTFTKVIDGAETNVPASDGEALILSTQVIGFDKGNRATRWAIGLGAGATKVRVHFVLKDATSGEELLKTDRQGKFYGTFSFVGGSKEHAVTEAAGDVVDGLIKEINQKR